MKTILAKFIGKTSAGYMTGTNYILNFYKKGEKQVIGVSMSGISDYKDAAVVITKNDGSDPCPYSTKESFLKNWTNIKDISD